MKKVKIGLGTCGISAGGEKVYQAFHDELVGQVPSHCQRGGTRIMSLTL